MAIFHTIVPKDVWFGDHLYIWSSPFHQHHGIVLFVDQNDPDKSQILEFNTYDGSHKLSRARVQIVNLKQFRKNCTLKRVVYGSRFARFKRAGTAYSIQSLAPEFVVDNAQHLVEQIKFGGYLLVPNDPEKPWDDDEAHGYNLILRNCECLAYWCKTGRWCSEQVEQLVENIGKYLLAFMKGIFDSLVRAKIIPAIGQEIISELFETALPSCASKFCTIISDGIGNGFAFLVVEVIKLIFRIYQLKHNQMTRQEFFDKTLTSVIKGLTIGLFTFLIQAILTYLSFGTAMAAPWIGGLAGSVIGTVVGDILGRLLVNGVAQLSHPALVD